MKFNETLELDLALETNGQNKNNHTDMYETDDYLIVRYLDFKILWNWMKLNRVYGKGSDLLVDRQHELYMIKQFSLLNIGPKLYATFDNGNLIFSSSLFSSSTFSNSFFL